MKFRLIEARTEYYFVDVEAEDRYEALDIWARAGSELDPEGFLFELDWEAHNDAGDPETNLCEVVELDDSGIPTIAHTVSGHKLDFVD